MRVVILTEGGQNIGFGHLTRCISLCQAFEERSIIPGFIVNGDDSINGLLKGKKCKIFNWLKERNKLFKIVENADIVIIDSYLAEKDLYNELSEMRSAHLVMIDDFNRLEYPKGIVINPSIYGNKLSYPKKDGVVYLLGKDYVILRKKFWEVPEKKINSEVKDVLITFGGMGNSELFARVRNFLQNKFDFNIDTVNPTEKMYSAEEIQELMLKADICISGGGQTTYELARVGVPTIGICFAENQLCNLESWYEEGFIEYIGWHNNKHVLEEIAKAIEVILSKEEREKRSKIGINRVDGKGSKRVIDRVLKT